MNNQAICDELKKLIDKGDEVADYYDALYLLAKLEEYLKAKENLLEVAGVQYSKKADDSKTEESFPHWLKLIRDPELDKDWELNDGGYWVHRSSSMTVRPENDNINGVEFWRVFSEDGGKIKEIFNELRTAKAYVENRHAGSEQDNIDVSVCDVSVSNHDWDLTMEDWN